MTRAEKRLAVRFYRTEGGAEPVRAWLQELSDDDRKLIGEDVKTLEFGWPIGMPTCRPLAGGLYEVRTNLKGRIARVVFCIEGSAMVLLHGFIKKSQATPKADLDLARARQRELLRQRR